MGSALSGTRAQPEVRIDENTNSDEIAAMVADIEDVFYSEAKITEPLPGDPCGLYLYGVNLSWRNKDVYKFLDDNQIKCQRVRKEKGTKFVSIYFDSNEDRQHAFSCLSSKRFGKKRFTVVPLRKLLSQSQSDLMAARYPNKRMKHVSEIVLPWLRIDYAEQIRQKSLKYRRTLDSICGRVWPVLDVIGARKLTNYLNQVQLMITLDEENEVSIGFCYGSGSVGGIEDCVHIPAVTEMIIARLADIIERSDVPVFDEETRIGIWKFVRICCNNDESQIMLIIGTYGKLQEDTLELLRAGFPEVTSLYWIETYTTESFTRSNVSHLISGEDHITMNLMDINFPVYPDTMFPANMEMTEALIRELVAQERIHKDTVVVEPDPNNGIYTLALAKFAGRVVAIDRDLENCRRIQTIAEENNIDNIQIIHGSFEEHYSTLQVTDGRVVTIVHPAEFGCRKDLYAALREAPFNHDLAIFSNNPEILVRELELFLLGAENTFEIESSLGFDIAPHTDKMQLLIRLKR